MKQPARPMWTKTDSAAVIAGAASVLGFWLFDSVLALVLFAATALAMVGAVHVIRMSLDMCGANLSGEERAMWELMTSTRMKRLRLYTKLTLRVVSPAGGRRAS